MTTTIPPRAEYKILVVEDDPSTRVALVDILREEGYAVESAADGEAALASIDRSLPHLVLTDMKMPKMCGTELARRIAILPVPPKVVVISGSLSEYPEYQGPSLGKPVDLDRLLEVVEGHRCLSTNVVLGSRPKNAGAGD